MFYKKFYENQIDEQSILKNHGNIFVSKSRVKALQEAEDKNFEIAIARRWATRQINKYDVNIVCFNNINWIGNGNYTLGTLERKSQ